MSLVQIISKLYRKEAKVKRSIKSIIVIAVRSKCRENKK